MSERVRQESREAYVLHAYPYRETSLLLDVFTRPFGRISMVARGARRPRSALRGVLLAFQPLSISWFGRGEVRTLARAEWLGGRTLLRGEALLCGFYLNELLMRLLPKEDPHETLFHGYRRSLDRLAAEPDSAPVLRGFEKLLLKELGYALRLEKDAASGRDIEPEKSYTYDPERGPTEVHPAGAGLCIRGRTLLDIARDDFSDPVTREEAKALMRLLIGYRLEHRPLFSRQVFRDLLQL